MNYHAEKYIIIKSIRKATRLTQKEFGERVGVGRDTITAVELGRVKNIQDVFFEHVCNVFHVSPDWLKTGQGSIFVEASTNLEEAVKLFESLDPSMQQYTLQQIQIMLQLQQEQKKPPDSE